MHNFPISAVAPTTKTIAVFDFDDTLNKGDSFFPFLVRVAGWPFCLKTLLRVLARSALGAVKASERRTFIKAAMLEAVLKGRRPEDLEPALASLKKWMRSLPAKEKLEAHYAQGDHVVIATGSLSLYMPYLLAEWPHHALICTEIGLKDGMFTGAMIKGNCVRQTKAERVKSYMDEQGPFEDSWGYGNAPHDLPMLGLMKHAVIV